MIRGGRQISFDVIANVRKVVKQGVGQGSAGAKVSYEVTVRRMNCLPDPPEPEVQCECGGEGSLIISSTEPFTVDNDVPPEVLRVLSTASNKDIGTGALGADKKAEGVKNEKVFKTKQQ